MKENSTEKAKKMAQEKAEQAKKMASEKLDQMKNISVDEAKVMAEEKIKKFKQMPMINKISYGAVAAAVLLGLVFTFSGGDGKSASNSSSTGELELFAYNGECEEGDLVETKQQNSRELRCKIGEGSFTILRQYLHASGKVKSETAYDLIYKEANEYAYLKKSFEKKYQANGDIISFEKYVNKLNASGKITEALLTEKISNYTNGKLRNKTTYAVKENDDGRWVSLKEHSFDGFDNGKTKVESSYEIKQDKSGTWVSLKKSHIKFNQAGKKLLEETYASNQNAKGKWYSAAVKIFRDNSDRSPAYVTELVLKENATGVIKSFKVSERSVDWKETSKYGKMNRYKVVQDISGSWNSLPKKEHGISNGRTSYSEYVIKKNSKSGNHKALKTLDSRYTLANGKKVLTSVKNYIVVENDTGSWTSLSEKNEFYNKKGVLSSATKYSILKDAKGNNAHYAVLGKKYGAMGEVKTINRFETKQNDNGLWKSLKVETIQYKYDRKQKRYIKEVKSDTKYELTKDKRGNWKSKRIAA